MITLDLGGNGPCSACVHLRAATRSSRMTVEASTVRIDVDVTGIDPAMTTLRMDGTVVAHFCAGHAASWLNGTHEKLVHQSRGG